jgi:hypothetical protein
MKLPGLRLQSGQVLEGSDVLDYLAGLGKPNEQGLAFTGTTGNGGAGVSLSLSELLTSPGELYYDTRLGQFVSTTPTVGNVPGLSGALFSAGGAGQSLVAPDGTSLFIIKDGVVKNVNGGTTPGANLVGLDGASLVGLDGASLVGLDGANLIGLDGASAVPAPRPMLGEQTSSPQLPGSNSSSAQPVLVGYPYFASKLPGAKYRLKQQTSGAPAAPLQRTTAGNVDEILLPGQTAVRAMSLQGEALTDWTVTGNSGAFVLPLPTKLPPIFFVLAQAHIKGAPLLQTYGLAFSAGSERRPVLIPLDSASTLVTGEILFTLEYAPKEIARLRKVLKDLKPNSNRRSAALTRIAELEEALTELNPLYYGEDLQLAESVVAQDDADGLNRAKALLGIYDIGDKVRKREKLAPPKGFKKFGSTSPPELQQIPTEEFVVNEGDLQSSQDVTASQSKQDVTASQSSQDVTASQSSPGGTTSQMR